MARLHDNLATVELDDQFALDAEECLVRIWMLMPPILFGHHAHPDLMIVDAAKQLIAVLVGDAAAEGQRINRLMRLLCSCRHEIELARRLLREQSMVEATL